MGTLMLSMQISPLTQRNRPGPRTLRIDSESLNFHCRLVSEPTLVKNNKALHPATTLWRARRAVTLLTILILMTLPASASPDLPAEPNILIIQSDDHGSADMSHTEVDTGVKTPNLDRLARTGVRFTNGYATSPICTPSRLGLLLGAYQQRYGNWWYGGPGLPGPEVKTIAEVLRGAGYRTAMFGKYHVNRDFRPGLRNFPLNHGFDRFFGFNAAAAHYLRRGEELETDFLQRLQEHEPKRAGYPAMFYQPYWDDTRQVAPEGFSTDLFANEAIEFINADSKKPFFVLLSFNAVHDDTSQLPEEYLREQGIEPLGDWDPAKEKLDEWKARVYAGERKRAYMIGQVELMDRAIGRILSHLDTANLLEDTVVIYVSDNGGSLAIDCRNDPLRGGKFSMCEGGLRTPFLVSWPGVFPEGRTIDSVVSTMDLLPTSARLAGSPIPEHVDGIDLVPLLTGEDSTVGHETLVWDVGTGKQNMWAVRHGDWKLYFSTPSKIVNEVDYGIGFRLTHLPEDVSETNNLIGTNPQKAAELGSIHRNWLESVLPRQDFEITEQ